MSIKYSTDEFYLDAATGVLKNKLGIKTEAELEAKEADIVFLRMVELWKTGMSGAFDFAHFKTIHRKLFGDIYDWAGETRIVNLAKGNSVFATPNFIEPEAGRIFSGLSGENYLSGLAQDAFCCRVAYYMAELNALHPFREGNGRTLREFMRQLALKNDYWILWTEITTEEMLEASITSFQGRMETLENLLKRNIFKMHEYDDYGLSLTRVFVPRGEPWRKALPERIEPLLSDEAVAGLTTLGELKSWIEKVSATAETRSPERYHLRHAAGNAKKWREELWPLCHFLEAHPFGDKCGFRIQPHGSQADVVLVVNEQEIPLQLTLAMDGEQESRRTEALTYAGHVSACVKIEKQKLSSGNYILSWRNEASEMEDDVAVIAERVCVQIRQKEKKGYPAGTWLLVDIDEPLFLQWPANSINPVLGAAKAEAEKTHFERVYVLCRQKCWQVK